MRKGFAESKMLHMNLLNLLSSPQWSGKIHEAGYYSSHFSDVRQWSFIIQLGLGSQIKRP